MKVLGIILLACLLTSCAHTPDSRDFLTMCKSACRGQVTHYQDDSIDCVCKPHGSNDVVKH